jgi:hypothetical protein
VIENVGSGIHHHRECPVAVIEVGDKHLNDDFWVRLSDCFDRLFEVFGTSVAEVVTCDGGDDHVSEVHAAGGFGDALRFVGF